MVGGNAADSFNFSSVDTTAYTIAAGAGTDKLNYAAALDTSALTVNLTSAGAGTVSGSGYGTTTFTGIEQVTTGAGNDTFKFTSNDTNSYSIDGGLSIDSLNYSSVSNALTVNTSSAGAGNVTGSGYGSTTYAGIEKIATGSGNDSIIINSADATAYTIEGGGGNDTINGGNSQASTLSYASAGSGVQLTINNADGNSAGGGGVDTFSNFTKFLGGNSADTFNLANNDNKTYDLKGGSGSDLFIVGKGSKAVIDGGALADNDTISYVNASSKVMFSVNAGQGSGTDQDTGSINFSNIKTFIGGTGGSEFTANSSDTTAYTFRGGSGTNTLTGGAGGDSLFAGSSNDSLIGGAGSDTLDFHTKNISLANVKADGGAGIDFVIIDQAKLGSSTVNLDGGTTSRDATGTDTSTDTLRVHGSASVSLNLLDLKAQNFEKLDMATDGVATKVLLSSAGIQQLVNNTSGADVLTLRLGSNDTYEVQTESGVTSSQGQFINFYTGTNTLIAQVKFEYA